MPERPGSDAPRSRATFFGLAFVSALLVALAYGQTLGFGFRYDDYHVVRPWTTGDIRAVLTGSWDPTGIEVTFYRPVTALWYALRFELFGVNAVAQHAVSLVLMAACALLLGAFVRRETGSTRAAYLGAALYAVHPAQAYAQAVWLTNQMHLLSSLVVIASLLVWQRVRARRTAAWWPLFVLQVVAFGIKEDLVMLLPALLALTMLRAALVRDVRAPRWSLAVASALILAALVAFRHRLLGTLGGYGAAPGVQQAWDNVTRGLSGVLRLTPARRPWQAAASVASQAALVAGGLATLVHRRDAHLFLSGLAVAVLFSLPFAFVTKAEQMHLVALGATLALTGALSALAHVVAAWRPVRHAAAAVFVVPLLFLPVTRHMAGDFAPCSPITLDTDRAVLGWHVVPEDIRAWLAAKPAACAAGAFRPLRDAVPTITWAHGLERDELDEPFRWTADRATVLAAPELDRLVLAVRRPDASAGDPVSVRIAGPSGETAVDLTDDVWHVVTVPLAAGVRSWRLGMQRVDIRVWPTFVPAERDAASPDTRVLGVQLKAIAPRADSGT